MHNQGRKLNGRFAKIAMMLKFANNDIFDSALSDKTDVTFNSTPCGDCHK